MTTKNSSLSPLAVSPAAAARLVGLGRTTIYEALKAGALASFKVGARRLILVADLRAWLQAHAEHAPQDSREREQSALHSNGANAPLPNANPAS